MSTLSIFTKIKKTSCKIQCVLHMTRFLVENFTERWVGSIIAFWYMVRHLLVNRVCSPVLIRCKCDKKFTEPKKYMRMKSKLTILKSDWVYSPDKSSCWNEFHAYMRLDRKALAWQVESHLCRRYQWHLTIYSGNLLYVAATTDWTSLMARGLFKFKLSIPFN